MGLGIRELFFDGEWGFPCCLPICGETTENIPVFFAASEPSPSKQEVSTTDQKVAGGAPPSGVAPIGDVDYTDIPNSQIRRVRQTAFWSSL